MSLKAYRSSLVAIGGVAIIAVGILTINSQVGRDESGNLELIRGECNREAIIPPQYRSSANRVKISLKSGSIDRWRDISFRSGKYNEGIYLPHPNPRLNEAGVRINVVEVHLSGGKTFNMLVPVMKVKVSTIGVSAPKYRYDSCLDLLKNDFVDYF
jgi:hypothetical protein